MMPLRMLLVVGLLTPHTFFDNKAEEYGPCVPPEPEATTEAVAPALAGQTTTEAAPSMPGDWSDARPVSLARSLPPTCDASLKEGWLRVHCHDVHPASGAVLSGPTEGVHFDLDRDSLTVTFPLERGVSRLLQLTEVKHVFRKPADRYTGVIGWQEPLVLISQSWPAHLARPVVTTDLDPLPRAPVDSF